MKSHVRKAVCGGVQGCVQESVQRGLRGVQMGAKAGVHLHSWGEHGGMSVQLRFCRAASFSETSVAHTKVCGGSVRIDGDVHMYVQGMCRGVCKGCAGEACGGGC